MIRIWSLNQTVELYLLLDSFKTNQDLFAEVSPVWNEQRAYRITPRSMNVKVSLWCWLSESFCKFLTHGLNNLYGMRHSVASISCGNKVTFCFTDSMNITCSKSYKIRRIFSALAWLISFQRQNYIILPRSKIWCNRIVGTDVVRVFFVEYFCWNWIY